MNIKEAKEQIKNAMVAYFTKDENGDYMLPPERQRPVFLMGPPGIGKTAIMEQIAAEMNVGILSYSMTHHTRQSALGLPFIEKKVYRGKEYQVSEYTMSEIIASVYDLMEETGIQEGILFLDEINCVSETLTPIMLQFLQYKVFGRHRVPEGWIVVTAGNPPEYNNSVKDFDIVTWDRLKRVDVEPSFTAWKEYAYLTGIHPAIMSYLEVKKDDFYKIETTVDGKSFVTARGWDDLSRMMKLYDANNLKIDGKLIIQYLQNSKIAGDFAAYYDLFCKYREDYQIDKILDGNPTDKVKKIASDAPFDERLSTIGLMLDAIGNEIRDVVDCDNMLFDLMEVLKGNPEKKTLGFKDRIKKAKATPFEVMLKIIEECQEDFKSGKLSGTMSPGDLKRLRNLTSVLQTEAKLIESIEDGDAAFNAIKEDFAKRVADEEIAAAKAGERLSNIFKFAEEVFEGGQELLIIVTELTANPYTSKYISEYGCEEYFKHNKDLLFYERQREIVTLLSELDLED